MILSSASHPSFLMMLEDINSNNTTALNPETDEECRFDVISRALFPYFIPAVELVVESDKTERNRIKTWRS